MLQLGASYRRLGVVAHGVATVVILLAGGCAASRRGELHLGLEMVRPPAAVVVFFVDGMDRRVMGELLAAGRLPHIAERFVRGGVEVEHAVSALPPITYAISVSLITGQYPGHHGVLGNRWFDPQSLVCRDYGSASTYRSVNDHFEAATIYEMLADDFTVNVQGHTRRGVARTLDNWASAGIDWGLGNYSNADRRVGECISEVADLARREGRWPTVLWHYFPGVDEIGHRWGSNSPQYAAALEVADAAIGRVCAALDGAPPAARLYYVLLADHGHVAIGPGHNFDLLAWLGRSRDLRIWQGPLADGDATTRRQRLARYDAVGVNGAFRSIMLHLRGADGWGSPVDPDAALRLIGPTAGNAGDALTEQPSVALVAIRAGPDKARIFAGRVTGVIERRGRAGSTEHRYTVGPWSRRADATNAGGMLATAIEPPESATSFADDPLGHCADPQLAEFVASGWHGSQEWLAATASTRYPDFVAQIAEMFDSPRAGDVVIFAADDWSFARDDRGGHGSCVAEDMRVPLFFAGPDLPAGGRIASGRLVDVVPTVLDLLGEGSRLADWPALDGISRAAELRAAAPPEPAPAPVQSIGPSAR